MVVNFEFLDDEPMENNITCMNFKVDKVVFFGYNHIIREQRDRTERFLTKYCGVHEVVFVPVSQYDLQSVLSIMRSEIQSELEEDNQIFFDITGGESLILVAFGMLSKEFETPMHMYDVAEGKLIELDEGAKATISTDVEKQQVKLTLDSLIESRGGKINLALQDGPREIKNQELSEIAERIFQVSKKYADVWNTFTGIMTRYPLAPSEVGGLQVSTSAREVIGALPKNGKLNTIRNFNNILDDLEEAGALLDLKHADGHYQYRFRDSGVKACFDKGGTPLELHTCIVEQADSEECMVGLHLDWDGVLHQRTSDDVFNEIDVLTIKDNIPTFISCKSGGMDNNTCHLALYELETVADRFGGKYAKKKLVITNPMGQTHLDRAKEMGIEVVQA